MPNQTIIDAILYKCAELEKDHPSADLKVYMRSDIKDVLGLDQIVSGRKIYPIVVDNAIMEQKKADGSYISDIIVIDINLFQEVLNNA